MLKKVALDLPDTLAKRQTVEMQVCKPAKRCMTEITVQCDFITDC